MQKKESSLLLMAKVIVAASSVIGIITIWGISYYMMVISASDQSQIPNSQIVLTQSSCSRLENKVAKDDCYMKVAKTRRDPAICSKVEIVEIRSLCFVELAEIKNDVAICENNNVSTSLLDVCREYFGSTKKDANTIQN